MTSRLKALMLLSYTFRMSCQTLEGLEVTISGLNDQEKHDANLTHYFGVEMAQKGKQWKRLHRYNDFVALKEKLGAEVDNGQFPGKVLPWQLSNRRLRLELWLQKAVQRPSSGSAWDEALIEFLRQDEIKTSELLHAPKPKPKTLTVVNHTDSIEKAETGEVSIGGISVGEDDAGTCPAGSPNCNAHPEKEPWHVQLQKQWKKSLKDFRHTAMTKGNAVVAFSAERPLSAVYIVVTTVFFSSLFVGIIIGIFRAAPTATVAGMPDTRFVHCAACRCEYRVSAEGPTTRCVMCQSGPLALGALPAGTPANFKSFKWKVQLGRPKLFRISWRIFFFFMGPVWLASLVLVFNPQLQPCGPTINFNEDLGQCFDYACNKVAENCLTHQEVQDNLGWRGWVIDIAGLNYHALWYDGSTCFRPSNQSEEHLFWLFFALECMGFFFTLLYSSLTWNCVARQNQLLDAFTPAFPRKNWPSIDVVLCHYSEESDDTIETLEKIMAMTYDYSDRRVKVYIGDDGPMKTKFTEGDGCKRQLQTVWSKPIPYAEDYRAMIRDILGRDLGDDDVIQTQAGEMQMKDLRTLERDDLVNKFPICLRVEKQLQIGWSKEIPYSQTYEAMICDVLGRTPEDDDVVKTQGGQMPMNDFVTLEGDDLKSKFPIKVRVEVGAYISHRNMSDVPENVNKGQFDVRAKVQALMTRKGCERTEHIVPPGDGRIRRLDCALGYIEDVYTHPNIAMPEVHYVARIKSKCFHSKAGNVNNILYNVQYKNAGKPDKSDYLVIFDNDMVPHQSFLVSTIPEFFEFVPNAAERIAPLCQAGCPYTDNTNQELPVYNNIAFVQTPQYFNPNALMKRHGDPLSHSNGLFFNSVMHGMDGYDSVMFVGTNVTWRRDALDSIYGIQYGTISEDFWTSLNAHKIGWDSAYIRKDRAGQHTGEHIRLAVGAVPDNVAASLKQRKRWHKGGVEIFLGMAEGKNNMETTDPGKLDAGKDLIWKRWARTNMKDDRPHILTRPETAGAVKRSRFRKLQRMGATWSFLQGLNPFILTALTCRGLISDKLWLYLNPIPTILVMIPYYFMQVGVPTLGTIAASSTDTQTDAPEFFTYAWVKLVGTAEVLIARFTGKEAEWGNTGSIGAGSKSELPTVFICFLITGCYLYSVEGFLRDGDVTDLAGVLAMWAFAWQQLYMYWRMAAPSLQELFGLQPFALKNAALAKIFTIPIIILVACLIKQKVENSLEPQYRCPNSPPTLFPSLAD